MSGLNLAQLAAHGFAKLTGTQRTAGAMAPIASTATGSVEMPYGLTYPAIRPSLDLDFANGQTIDPRITFTRASTATRTNARGLIEAVASGVPRIDFDAVTGVCKGLLIEEQRANLLTYSEQFDNAAWTKTRTTITANATTAPDGTLTADKLIEDTSASTTHRLGFVGTFTTGVSYTFSFYAKAGERSTIFGNLESGVFPVAVDAVFNLSAGTVSGASGAIQPVGNGWYRCSITSTAISSNVAFASMFAYNGSLSYTGDGTSGLFIWGAQLEAGAFPTSYIPTVASQVTRVADVATMTGANFSSWYRQDEGSFVASASSWSVSTKNAVLFSANDGAGAVNLIDVTHQTDEQLVFRVRAASATVFNGLGFSASDGVIRSVSLAYKSGSSAYTKDGATAATNSAAFTQSASLTALSIGGNHVSGDLVNGHIRSLTYYPKRLTNAELQALSTQ